MRQVRRRESPLPPALPNDTTRWLGALDALAPYLIAVIAVAIAKHGSSSSFQTNVAVVIAVVLLASGTAVVVFRTLSPAHLTWPVAFVLCVVFVPLVALHSRLESTALATPVAIHLLPLAFTWTSLLIAFCLIVGMVCTMSAEQPGWAGALVSPIAVLLGAAPLLSLDPAPRAVLTTILSVLALAEIVSGVTWLLPERRRWFVIPVVLTLAVAIVGRSFFTTPHHLPGRVLLLADAALAVFAGLTALAAPLICRWLGSTGGAGVDSRDG